jgi:hypothetical protein
VLLYYTSRIRGVHRASVEGQRTSLKDERERPADRTGGRAASLKVKKNRNHKIKFKKNERAGKQEDSRFFLLLFCFLSFCFVLCAHNIESWSFRLAGAPMTQQQTDDADVPMGGTQDEEGSVGGKCVQRRA